MHNLYHDNKRGKKNTVNLIPQFSAIKNKIKQGPSDKIKKRNQMKKSTGFWRLLNLSHDNCRDMGK